MDSKDCFSNSYCMYFHNFDIEGPGGADGYILCLDIRKLDFLSMFD